MMKLMIAGAVGFAAATAFAAVASAEPAKKDTGLGYITDGKSYERKPKVVTPLADGTVREERRLNDRCVQVTIRGKGQFRSFSECKKD